LILVSALFALYCFLLVCQKFSLHSFFCFEVANRLGEFSPFGWLFTLSSSFFKITEVEQIYRLLSRNVLVIFLFRQKMCWATFFTNSSGYPGYQCWHERNGTVLSEVKMNFTVKTCLNSMLQVVK
jgi:hypothetical protein